MSKVFIEESTLTAIGDSIRDKTGKQDLISPLNMPTEIESIKGGNIIKTVSGTCPINLENCVEGNLLDYKIYGAEGGVGDLENLFDKHYDVGYVGTAPNVAVSQGGLSTEWYELNKIGSDFTLALNPREATTSVVVGYIQSNDKSTIEIRRGFINAGNLTINVDNFSNFTISNTQYKYIKFYVITAAKVNDIRVYKGSNNKLTTPYGIWFPIKVNETDYKLLLDINGSLHDGDYLDFENRKAVINGVTTMVELPEIPLQEGTNTFDVKTTVKPSNVSLTYVKNVDFNTMKTVEGTLPLTVEGVGQRLEDYKIYGNEGGVGDVNRLNHSGADAGYIEVEYIESNGTQYIDTGYIPTENTRVDLKWLSTAISGAQAVVGCGWNGNAMLLNIQSNKWCFHGSGIGTIAPSLTDPDIISFGAAANSFVVNGVTYNNAKDNLSNATTNLKVFGLNGNDGFGARGKLYYLNIYEGDTLIHEYIPVIKETTCGLWDNVTNEFITSSAGKTFISGPTYCIAPIKVNDDVYNVNLVSPLNSGDYIDFENRKAVISGVETHIDLPEIYLQNGQNIIDVDTTVKPSKMSVSYIDNDGGYDAGYKKGYDAMKLAIDMSDTDYQFNETVTSYPSNWYRVNLNFTDANGKSYKQMASYTSSGKINIQYTPTSGSAVNAYNAANSPAWANEAYRTIHITDGTMTGDIETFRWLFKNGVFNPTA